MQGDRPCQFLKHPTRELISTPVLVEMSKKLDVQNAVKWFLDGRHLPSNQE